MGLDSRGFLEIVFHGNTVSIFNSEDCNFPFCEVYLIIRHPPSFKPPSPKHLFSTLFPHHHASLSKFSAPEWAKAFNRKDNIKVRLYVPSASTITKPDFISSIFGFPFKNDAYRFAKKMIEAAGRTNAIAKSQALSDFDTERIEAAIETLVLTKNEPLSDT
jgi:hypothetical protein